jgi:hypothetical protein
MPCQSQPEIDGRKSLARTSSAVSSVIVANNLAAKDLRKINLKEYRFYFCFRLQFHTWLFEF